MMSKHNIIFGLNSRLNWLRTTIKDPNLISILETEYKYVLKLISYLDDSDQDQHEPMCPHCKFLDDTFLKSPDVSERDYYLMTEVFVYLHKGDECNYIPGIPSDRPPNPGILVAPESGIEKPE